MTGEMEDVAARIASRWDQRLMIWGFVLIEASLAYLCVFMKVDSGMTAAVLSPFGAAITVSTPWYFTQKRKTIEALKKDEQNGKDPRV